MPKLLTAVKEIQLLRVIVATCAITVTTTCYSQAFSTSAPNGDSAASVIPSPESKTSPLPDAPTAQQGSFPAARSTGTASHGANSQVYVFPTFGERKKHYIYDLVGPGAFIGAAVQSAIDQTHPLKVGYPPDGFVGIGKHPAHGSVPEWGEGADGFGKRYASRFGPNRNHYPLWTWRTLAPGCFLSAMHLHRLHAPDISRCHAIVRRPHRERSRSSLAAGTCLTLHCCRSRDRRLVSEPLQHKRCTEDKHDPVLQHSDQKPHQGIFGTVVCSVPATSAEYQAW
jgi:hypothetical protein